MKKITIKGCDARGDGQTPYLTRWYLFQSKHLNIYLHKFHRADSDELHDHPWDFISIVLWNGYVEETFKKTPGKHTLKRFLHKGSALIEKAAYGPLYYKHVPELKHFPTKKKRIYPGQIIFRKATHAHRVELINDKPAYTLLINFGYVRQWGFFTKNYWQHFMSYFKDNECGPPTVENV